MNLESNAAKTIAALVVLNAGLLVSHHVPVQAIPLREAQVQMAANRAEICKARSEAHKAAMEARLQARAAVREMRKARREIRQSAAMAPTASQVKTRTTVTDYVRCIVSSGIRTLASGI